MLIVRVTKAAGDSTLARIIQLIGEAEEQKPPTQRWVDRFAAFYTPAVFIAAILVADKTGTITQGKPQVVGITTTSELTDDEILRLAAAIVDAAHSRNLNFEPAADYLSVTGRGARAKIGGHPHFIESHKMAHEAGVCTPEIEAILTNIESKGQSLAILGHAPHEGCVGKILGIIAIADTLRPEVTEALRRIHAAGIEKVIMLSGDNQRTASAIAKQAGIDEAIGDLMPDQKVEHV